MQFGTVIMSDDMSPINSYYQIDRLLSDRKLIDYLIILYYI